MKKMSKAIYKPIGKAGEYAEWACNLYVGCSNDCSYCYCKKGVLAHAMGVPEAKLKACFKDEDDAMKIFIKELEANLPELQKSSLFFTFSSDPMIPQTRELNWRCIIEAVTSEVPCQILTKNADFVDDSMLKLEWAMKHSNIHTYTAWGFTLTGADELEPGASTNKERINTMRRLHDMGFRTFASIEPVVSPEKAAAILQKTKDCCDLYKVGLMSGVKQDYYNKEDILEMVHCFQESGKPVYLKKSITGYLSLPEDSPKNIFDIEKF